MTTIRKVADGRGDNLIVVPVLHKFDIIQEIIGITEWQDQNSIA